MEKREDFLNSAGIKIPTSEQLKEIITAIKNNNYVGRYPKYKCNGVCDFIESIYHSSPYGELWSFIGEDGFYIIKQDTPWFSGVNEYYEYYKSKDEPNQFEDLSEDNKMILTNEYNSDYHIDRQAWMDMNHYDEAKMKELDALREQYQAIKDWEQNPNDSEKIQKVRTAYQKTGINVLQYIKDSQQEDFWRKKEGMSGPWLWYMFYEEKPPKGSLQEKYPGMENDRLELIDLIQKMYKVSCQLVDQIGMDKDESKVNMKPTISEDYKYKDCI